MSNYEPSSNIEKFNENTIKDIPRKIFNSGYSINEKDMHRYQKLMQNSVLNNFRSMIKYPGIIIQN